MAALGDADIGGHRDDGDTRDEAARDREHCGGGRFREDSDALCDGDALGDRGRTAHQVATAEDGTVDADRVSDVSAGGYRCGIQ